MSILHDLLIIFAVALTVAFILRLFKVPSLAGFIVAGVLVGPKSLGLISDIHKVEVLAEIGVVLLLFGIGLELSLDKIRRLYKPILLGGSLQVGLTIAATAVFASLYSLSLGASIFVGCMIAVSSTAIVLRGLEYRGEIDAPHGRFALGILVFQDLSVIPMVMLVPVLSGQAGMGLGPLWAFVKAGIVIAAALLAARIVVPRVLHSVAKTGQRDLFVLAVFLVCIGTAWIVSLANVSLALGAFLGGLVVAGSDYRDQALSDLIPFREVLASLFFISVGMLLDPVLLFRDTIPVLLLFVVIIFGKFVVILLVGMVMRLPLRVSMITGMTLSQVGEFLFVLMRASQGTGILETNFSNHLMMAAILSMLVTPLLMFVSPHIAAGIGRFGILEQYLGVQLISKQVQSKISDKHVIIAGFGIAGRELTRALKDKNIPYMVIDLNAETIRQLIKAKEPGIFGDVTSRELLHRLGIQNASQFVIAINDPEAAFRATKIVRKLVPELPVLVRVRYVGEVERFLKTGATHVVPSEYESAVEIVAQVLLRQNISREEINTYVESMHTRCKVKNT